MKIIIFFLLFLLSGMLSAQNLAVIDSLKTILTVTSADTSRINVLIDISKEYQSSNPELCLQHLNKALKESRRIKWDKGTLKLCHRMGALLVSYGEPDSALTILFEGLSQAQKLNNHKSFGNIQINIGTAYNQKSDYKKAMNYFENAVTIAQKHNLGKTLSNACTEIGKIHELNSNFEKAIFYHLKSYTIGDSINDSEVKGVALGNLATVYFKLGNYDKAKEYNFEGLALWKKMDRKSNTAATLNNIGNLYLQKNNPDSAIIYYSQALKIAEETSDKYGLGLRLTSLGNAYNLKEDFNQSIAFYEKAITIRNSIGDKRGVSQCFNNMGESYRKINEYEKAIISVSRGLEIAREISLLEEIIHSYQLYSDIYSAKQDFKNAYHYKELESAIKDSISTAENKKQIAEMSVKFDTEKKEAENKLLQQQNKIQSLTISNNRYLLFGLIGALILFVIIALLIFRQNKLNSQQQAMQLEQKLLRSQMNPHFIFNSLQAIQNFILKKDEKEAAKYLSSFATLTRSVLENSRMETISLKKEITLLDDYLALQKLRFSQRFEYSINVSPEIDTDYATLPPMLSQPFIENAIEHGMRDIESGGFISVSFSENNNNLLLEIKDNGKGMNSHNENKAHHSLAMTITKERIGLLNKKSTKKIDFSITDAYPEKMDRKGVKVNFIIPL